MDTGDSDNSFKFEWGESFESKRERERYEFAKDLRKGDRSKRNKRIIREYEKKHGISKELNVNWAWLITIIGLIASIITIYTFIVS